MSGIKSWKGQTPAPRLNLPGIPKARARPGHLEHLEQCAFFDMVRLHPATRELVIYAVPNSALAGSTKKDQFRMVRAKREGLLPGVPDVNVDVPVESGSLECLDYAMSPGLRLEFKRDELNKDGTRPASVRPSPEQLEIHEKLRRAGYRVEVVYTAGEAWRVLCEYLGIPSGIAGDAGRR